jgi:predicted nucleic acid-binding protein
MLLDTSTIIEISRSKKGSGFVRAVLGLIPEGEQLFVSIIQFSEIADWCLKNDLSVEEELSAVKEFAEVIPLDESICREAAKIKKRRRKRGHKGFGLIDGIILATSKSVGQKLLTLDTHFSKETNCIVLEKSN